jgi:hypothetical protein
MSWLLKVTDMRVTFFNKKGRLLYSFRLCHILPGIAIFHNSDLVIPYGMSDIASGIATVGVSEPIDCMCAVA